MGTDAAIVLNSRHNSFPDIPGSFRSSSTALGGCLRNVSSPEIPSEAICTCSESASSNRCSVRCIARLSSTTSTVSVICLSSLRFFTFARRSVVRFQGVWIVVLPILVLVFRRRLSGDRDGDPRQRAGIRFDLHRSRKRLQRIQRGILVPDVEHVLSRRYSVDRVPSFLVRNREKLRIHGQYDPGHLRVNVAE